MDITNHKIGSLHDNQLKAYLVPMIFTGLRMLSLMSTEEHAKQIFDGIIWILRKKYSDFTAYDVLSSIERGITRYYGEYSKMNPYTIIGWLEQRKKELRDAEEKEEQRDKFKDKNSFVLCSNGGYACLLGLIYDEMGKERYSFEVRKKLLDENKKCPHTGKSVNLVIKENLQQVFNKLNKKLN